VTPPACSQITLGLEPASRIFDRAFVLRAETLPQVSAALNENGSRCKHHQHHRDGDGDRQEGPS
jgi:hypothetical protein